MDLDARLRERMARAGPMSFCDWMDACLYDPDGGYYMRPGRKTGPGDDADFATNPTLHPFFAKAVAREALAAWESMGRPEDFHIIEFGGGEGDLARDALAWLDEHRPELADSLQWSHVERSPVHQGQQADEDPRIRAADKMPAGTVGLVLAHEFVDALPVHLLEWRKGDWAEVYLQIGDGRYDEVLGIPSRAAVEAAPKRLPDEGQRVVSMADGRAWVEQVSERLERGMVLIADYGDKGSRLWTPDRPDGTVRGFRHHRLVDDVLAEPAGSCDITTSVDFTQLQQWATFEGLDDLGLETQESFLVRHGVMEALAAAPRDTVEEASAYLRLKQMMLPTGMGAAFKVQRFGRRL